MPYEADFFCDYKGLKKATRARLIIMLKEYWWLFLLIYIAMPGKLIIFGIMKNNASDIFAGASASIFLIVVYAFVIDFSVRRQVKTNKALGNLNVHYTFNEEDFEWTSPKVSARSNYSAIYRIVEDKNFFFLKPSARQMMIVPKENCSSELIAFLENQKTEINCNKNKTL